MNTEFIHGIPINEQAHRMAFAGYEHEGSILSLLLSAGVITQVNVEVIAPFDDRLRGHVDAVSSGDMLEIKSVSTNKFQQIVQTQKAIRKHFIQVQLYLHYGGWKQAFMIYRCRETYEHLTLRIPYISHQADRFERRAKMMLAHIHRGELPDCECGNCK